MEQTMTFDSPDELRTFVSQAQEHTLTNKHIRLRLLHPLADPVILASCRQPSSYHERDNAGRVRRDSFEWLKITRLGEMWREVWKDMVPESLRAVTFDLSLPLPPVPLQYKQDVSGWRPCWRDAEGIEIGIDEHAVARLVILLATVMRMRASKERELMFDRVLGDEPSAVCERFERLAKILDGLSRKVGNT
jgi:hypothetical protein